MYGKPEFADKYTEMADQMITLIENYSNDHHNVNVNLANHDWLKVEPDNLHLGDDIVTFQGLNKLLKVYLGQATGVFKWVGRSTVGATPTPFSVSLASETGSRQDSTTTGFQDIKGASLRVFSSYATNIASFSLKQIGIFDASAGGNMLAIHDLSPDAFAHVQNVDSFSLGMVIDFLPFGDV